MIEPYFRVENEFGADSLCFLQNSIFAFDFKEQVFWMGNIINNNQAKKFPLSVPKSSFMHNKIALNPHYFAYIDANENSAQVIDLMKGKVLHSLQITDSKIESVSINEKCVLLGGKNGVLASYDITSGKLLHIPARHKDFVLLSQASPNQRFIISIGYDRSMLFFDKHKNATAPLNISVNGVIKCARFIADSAILVLGDAGGMIYIIDCATQSLLRKFQAGYAQIVEVCHYKDAYIFVLSSNGNLVLCDFSTGDKIMDGISQEKFSAFTISDDCIILAKQGQKAVVGYRFSDFVAHCQRLIDEDNIVEAYKFANIYKFLHNESFYISLEAKFEAEILEAKTFACNGNIPLAEHILGKYVGIPSKAVFVSALLKQAREIAEFNELMAKKLEIRAIPMAQNNPLIRELESYKDFEARFLKIILLVKELVKKGKKDDANAIVMPYKKIPSKVAIIQEVLLYPQKVDEVLCAIAAKDYREYFKLKKAYRFVEIFSKDIEVDAESIYFQALKTFYKLNIKECKECIEVLKNFRKYRDFAQNLEVKLDEIVEVLGAF